MELIMLEKIDRKNLLANVDAKKQQEQQKEEVAGSVVIYDPKPQEIMDSVVSEKILLLKTARAEKKEAEKTEIKKLMNAVTFTDVPATIKKAGFHSDGSPKVAIAGLFDRDVGFIVRDKQAKYRSDSLLVILADVKNDWRNLICFFVGLTGVVASMCIGINATFEDLGYYNNVIIPLVSMLIPLLTLIFVAVPTAPKYGSYFTYLELPDIGKVRTRSNFYTNIPVVPESVLSKISGPGPFAILFEVTEGWRKIKPDPVILRVININQQQFFEPVVGYDMTPLEKKSLTETQDIT